MTLPKKQSALLEWYRVLHADRAQRMMDLTNVPRNALCLFGVQLIVRESSASLKDLATAQTDQQDAINRQLFGVAIAKAKIATLTLIENAVPILQKQFVRSPRFAVVTVQRLLAVLGDLDLDKKDLGQAQTIEKDIGRIGCLALVEAKPLSTQETEAWLSAAITLRQYAPPATKECLHNIGASFERSNPDIAKLQGDLHRVHESDRSLSVAKLSPLERSKKSVKTIADKHRPAASVGTLQPDL